MAIESKKLTFAGSKESELAARLDLPEGTPRAYALFVHCFTCSKDVFAANRISQALTQYGFATLRFDFTGLGASEGDFSHTNFSTNLEDLRRAVDFMRENLEAPAVMIGHSLGGAAVLACAGAIPEVKAVVTLGAPCDPGHVTHLFKDGLAKIQKQGHAVVDIGGRPFTVRREFLDDIEGHQLHDKIENLRKALLVLHAPRDALVSIDSAGDIFGAARHPKSFISLDTADHLLTRRQDANYAAEVIAAWSSRYLSEGTQAGHRGEESWTDKTQEGVVVVEEKSSEGFAQTVRSGKHVMAADEPVAFGGTDTGLSPYDYLLAGLGACTSMTLRLYARRKEWPLEKIRVTLRHEKIHAEDCAACETATGKIDVIEREIVLTGNLDEDQKARLLDIADKCPVHRTLHSEVQVRTKIKQAAD